MNKGFEALNRIKMLEISCDRESYDLRPITKTHKEDLDTIEKELKALEIIKHHLSEQVANIELGKPQKCLLMLIMENDKNYDLLKEVLL